MTRLTADSPGGIDINDLLLYLGAAIVAGVAVSWILLARPWEDAAVPEPLPPDSAAHPAQAFVQALDASDIENRSIDETLRLADLSRATGMLLEPSRYNAWALYAEVLAIDPSNALALDGIARVADSVVARGATALEQGRTADAKTSAEAVLTRLPGHAGALELSRRIDERTRSMARRTAARRPPAAPAEPEQQTSRTAAAATSPLQELRNRFDTAVGAGRLLEPADDNARLFLAQMSELDAVDPITVGAREMLLSALLARARGATEALDTAAAEVWIAQAVDIGPDPERIEEARRSLIDRLIEVESLSPVPAASLAISDYTPPRFPRAARNLELAGWVDLEFVVEADGATRDVTVVGGSREDVFGPEAVAAVSVWRFEPRAFLGHAIPQRAYTRIRFEIE